MQSLKDLVLTVWEKAKIQVSSNKKICQIPPLNMHTNQKKLYIHDLLYIMKNPTKFQLNWIRTWKFQLKCLTLLWPWNVVKVTESYMNGLSSVISAIMQSWTFVTFIVSEKIARFMPCQPITQLASWPSTDHIFPVGQKACLNGLWERAHSKSFTKSRNA